MKRQVGTAEAHAHLGALAAAAGDATGAQQYYAAAATAYVVAVAQPHALGLFPQRCDVWCVSQSQCPTRAAARQLPVVIHSRVDNKWKWDTTPPVQLKSFRVSIRSLTIQDTSSSAIPCRYNYACAAAQCERQQEAETSLRRLAAVGRLSAADLNADKDFAAVRQQPWFQQLLAECGHS